MTPPLDHGRLDGERREEERREEERHRRTRWQLIWAVAALVAVAAFVIAALDQPVERLVAAGTGPLARVLLVLLGCAAVVLAHRAAVVLSRLDRTEVSRILPRQAPERVLGVFPSQESLRADRRTLTDTYAKPGIVLFGRILIRPEYRLRLEETIHLDSDKARTQSKAEFFIPWAERTELLDACTDGARPEVVLVPLLWLPKGTLLDDFVVTDAAGVRLPVLSRVETAALVGWACVPLFAAATTGDMGTRFDDARWAAMNDIRQLLAYPDPRSPDELWDRVEHAMRERGLDPARLAAQYPLSYANFRRMCRSLAEHYVLAVEAPVPAGAFLAIQYTHSVTIPALGRGGLPGKLEELIGLEPSRFEIPIVAAELFASYHAEIDGRARDRYVRSQEVVNKDVPGFPRVGEAEFRPDPHAPDHPPRLMLRNDSGFSYPHLHLTNLGYLRPPPRLGWRVRFEEIPPGGLGPVIAMSLAVTLISMVFAVAAPRMTAFDLDAPALALAVPLFVITVVGFSFTRLLRSTLTVVAGFAVASVLAVLAVVTLLTLRDVRDGQPQPFVLTEPTILGQRIHLLLGLCALAGVFFVGYLVAVLTVRTRRYAGHRRRVHDTIGGENGR